MDQPFLLDNIDAFIFDFDGVMTNNLVHLDQHGNELVTCNRGDGLAFDILRKLQKPSYILSTESNPVVKARANKLKIPALYGVDSKVEAIKKLSGEEGFDIEKVLYVGNDLNDYRVMQMCGYSVCPADSHKTIKSIASFVLRADGGGGVVRELLEDVLNINFIEILYPE